MVDDMLSAVPSPEDTHSGGLKRSLKQQLHGAPAGALPRCMSHLATCISSLATRMVPGQASTVSQLRDHQAWCTMDGLKCHILLESSDLVEVPCRQGRAVSAVRRWHVEHCSLWARSPAALWGDFGTS